MERKNFLSLIEWKNIPGFIERENFPDLLEVFLIEWTGFLEKDNKCSIINCLI